MPRKRSDSHMLRGWLRRSIRRARVVLGRLLKVRWVRFLYAVLEEMGADRADDAAAAIAYYAVLSLFPLLLGVIVLLSLFVPGDEVPGRLFDVFRRFLPGITAEYLQQNIAAVAQVSGALSAISLIGLFWSGSRIFGAIGRFMNQAWGISTYRPFLVRKIRDMALAVAASILFFTSFGVTALSLVFQDMPLLEALAGRLVAYGLVFVVFLLSYKYGPNTRVEWRDLWPGTAVASLAFELFRSLFLVYLGRFANFEEVYGPLASFIVLLVWIYISALLLMFGAEFVSEYARTRRGHRRSTAGRRSPAQLL